MPEITCGDMLIVGGVADGWCFRYQEGTLPRENIDWDRPMWHCDYPRGTARREAVVSFIEYVATHAGIS